MLGGCRYSAVIKIDMNSLMYYFRCSSFTVCRERTFAPFYYYPFCPHYQWQNLKMYEFDTILYKKVSILTLCGCIQEGVSRCRN